MLLYNSKCTQITSRVYSAFYLRLPSLFARIYKDLYDITVANDVGDVVTYIMLDKTNNDKRHCCRRSSSRSCLRFERARLQAENRERRLSIFDMRVTLTVVPRRVVMRRVRKCGRTDKNVTRWQARAFRSTVKIGAIRTTFLRFLMFRLQNYLKRRHVKKLSFKWSKCPFYALSAFLFLEFL